MDVTSIAILIPLLSGAVVSVISTIQNSRCSQIKLCCGLLSCIREVPNVSPHDDEPEPIAI